MIAQWVLLDSPLHRDHLAAGWQDTGFVRRWCGGTLQSVMLVRDERTQARADADQARQKYAKVAYQQERAPAANQPTRAAVLPERHGEKDLVLPCERGARARDRNDAGRLHLRDHGGELGVGYSAPVQ